MKCSYLSNTASGLSLSCITSVGYSTDETTGQNRILYVEVEMSDHFGVRCRHCQKPIVLADYSEESSSQTTVYTVPISFIKCPHCGKSSLYGATDGHFFSLVAPTSC
jgi:endogenous inhibitor of DNA gyrase (YacG/DUF329 family)